MLTLGKKQISIMFCDGREGHRAGWLGEGLEFTCVLPLFFFFFTVAVGAAELLMQ